MSTRWTSRTRWTALAFVMITGVALAPEERVEACGPGFPTNLIVRRADALATLWDGSFVDEAAVLVPVAAADRKAFAAPAEKVLAGARERALYDQAAAAFHAERYAEAARGFAAVLRLPAGDRQGLSLAAAYSLGRTYDAAEQPVAAVAAYRRVRELARAGFVDDGGFAVSSLGQEARTEGTLRGDLVAAVRLYAQQAAFAGSSGRESLLFVARATTPAQRGALYRDDLGTAVLALYYYTRRGELSDEDRVAWGRELAQQATTEARGAAYLAAAAYREGAWEQAAALAAVCRRAPIATWVRAKLALRDGDRERAEALLRTVERRQRGGAEGDIVRGELGLLALADARFPEAADWFDRGQHAVEAAYVAERAMSLDELQAAVRASEPARAAPAPTSPEDADADPCSAWFASPDPQRHCWGTRLLDIYARRLVREHLWADAREAFGERNEDAVAYMDAIERADATSGIERAEHLFAAARVLREHGLALAGTEAGPDWRMYDGAYARTLLCLPSPTRGYARYAQRTDDDYEDDWVDCFAPTHEDAALVSALEVARVRASAPEIDQRFSYRYVAAGLAEAAANLVPPRSQAYATALCWAAKFASRDSARVDQLYATYLRNGATGAFGSEFGVDCDEPDFHAARTFDERQAERRLQRALDADRARAWTWPRIRAALWRRRGWLVYPFALIAGIAMLALSVRISRFARRRSTAPSGARSTGR